MIKLPRQAKSIWRDSYPQRVQYPALADNVTTDVVVVGAGITGLTSAYLLKQAGLSVIVIDKDTVGGGTTGRSTGKVTAQHNITYADMQKRLGTKNAQAYATANMAAVEQVAHIIRKEQIECEWERQDNYVYTTSQEQVAKFRQELAVSVQLGLPASFETTTPLPFDVAGAIKFTNQGKIHAQKYLLGLAKAVHQSGSTVHERTKATHFKDGKTTVTVKTPGGTITAKHCIVATNVPTLPLIARGTYCFLEFPTESYIVAGRLQQPLSGMYISPQKYQYSLLPAKINGQDYLLVGGEGHLSGMRGDVNARYQRLAAFAHKNFGVTDFTHRWSDRDYLAYDQVPLAGKLYPWTHNIYVATAFRKWGLSNGTASAILLRDLIMGIKNPWADTFTTQRSKPILSMPRAISILRRK